MIATYTFFEKYVSLNFSFYLDFENCIYEVFKFNKAFIKHLYLL